MLRTDPSQLLTAILLDLLVGDPRQWPHIARLTGGLSTRYEKILTGTAKRSVALGILFWGLVAGTIFAGYALAYFLCLKLSWVA
ncbi:MAG TPA: cobalamin biosynthesis protein, partial [Chthoniobacterales bacterium]|nr:cobalamin biosynthesis protein [Chthoniobacterales bacterium]